MRISAWTVLVTLLAYGQTEAAGIQIAQVQVTSWLNGAKGAHTLAHDDYCSPTTSGLEQYALPELNKRGLNASFGVIASNCTEAQWQQMKADAALGHEFFNHTLTHMGEFNDSAQAMPNWQAEAEIKQAHDLVLAKTGLKLTFVAFPFDLASDATRSYVQSLGYLGMRAAQALYNGKPAGRNGSGHQPVEVFNWGNNSNNPFFVKWDAYDQKCTWSLYEAAGSAGKGVCPSTPNDILIRHAQNAIDNGTWTYRTMHGVADASWQAVPLEQYTTYLDFLKKKVDRGELWVATPSDVLRYRATRANCGVQIHDNQITFDTSKPECSQYASVITLDLALNGAFSSAEQQGIALPLQPTATANHWYVNVNPLNGPVTLK